MEVEAPKDIDADLRMRAIDDQLGIRYSGFVRKVFALIGTQVLMTAIVIWIVKSSDFVMQLLTENLWVLIPVVVVFVVTALIPICCQTLGRKVPLNYIILYTFVRPRQTFSAALLVSFSCLEIDNDVIIAAGVLTIVVTAALIGSVIFVTDKQCAIDFRVGTSLLVVMFMTSISWFLLSLFLPSTSWVTIGCCALGALIFGLYIVIDTAIILDGNKYGITNDDYVFDLKDSQILDGDEGLDKRRGSVNSATSSQAYFSLRTGSLTEKINLQHLIELREKFDKADVDHGGALELDEFVEAFGEVLGVGLSRKQLVQLFMRIDANSDGSIDWEEFMNYILLENESLSSMRAEHCEYVNPKISDPISHRGPFHTDMITRLLMLPPSESSEHHRYLTSSRDGSVKVWNAQTNSLITTIEISDKTNKPAATMEVMKKSDKAKAHNWVTTMEVLRRSEKLAVGLMDRSIVFCDMKRPNDPSMKCIPVSRISYLKGIPTCMDYIEDKGQELLAVGYDYGGLSLYRFGQDWHICNILMDCHRTEIERNQKDQLNVYEAKRKKFVGKEVKELPVMTHLRSNVEMCDNERVHTAKVNKLQYISDLDGILTASSDSTLKLIDLERLEERKVHRYHHKAVLSFAWCRDFKFIASCGEERNIIVWNPFSKNAAINYLHGHNAAIVDITLNEDKCQLISLGVDKVIKIWDIRNYRCIQTVVDKTSYHPDNMLTGVQYDPRVCGILLTSRKVNMWPFKAQEDMQTSHDSPVSAARFNRNFNSIISVDDESNVYVWDIEDGKLMFKYPDAHGKNKITAIAFDTSLRRLITGGHDGSIKMWNFSNGHCLRDFLYDFEPKEISAITFVPDPKVSNVITVGWDRNIYIWPDENEQAVYPAKILPKPGHTGHTDDVISVLYCQREKVLVTGAHNGEIIVWQYETGFEKAFLHEIDPTCLPAVNAAQEGKSVESLHYLTPQDTLLSVCANGVLRFWDLQNMSLLLATRIKHLHKDCVSASALSPDCQLIATGDESGNLKLMDISAFDRRRPADTGFREVFFINVHSGIVNSVDIFKPDEHDMVLIATSSFDRNVKLLTLQGQILGYFGQGRKWDLSADLSSLPPGPPAEHPTVYISRRGKRHLMPDEEASADSISYPESDSPSPTHSDEQDHHREIMRRAREKGPYQPPSSFGTIDTSQYTLENVQDSPGRVLTHRTGLDLDNFKTKFSLK